MKPKDKAIELIDKIIKHSHECDKKEAVQCALISVDELIKETSFEVPNIRQRYWIEVKQEIEKL